MLSIIDKHLKGVDDADRVLWAELGRTVVEVGSTVFGISRESGTVNIARAAHLETVLFLKAMDIHLDPSYTLHIFAAIDDNHFHTDVEQAMVDLDCAELIESIRVV